MIALGIPRMQKIRDTDQVKKAVKRAAGRPSVAEAPDLASAILKAAEVSFQADGFSGTTMRKVAQLARVTPQTLYARFADKTALFEALMTARTDTLLESALLIFEDGAGPEQVLQAFGERIVSTFLNSEIQRLHQLVIGEAKAFPRLAQTFYEKGPSRGRKLLLHYLSKQMECGELTIAHVDIAGEQFVGSLIGGVISRSTLSQEQPLKTEADISLWVSSAVGAFLRAYRSGS